jgi:hypothetical protein
VARPKEADAFFAKVLVGQKGLEEGCPKGAATAITSTVSANEDVNDLVLGWRLIEDGQGTSDDGTGLDYQLSALVSGREALRPAIADDAAGVIRHRN